jgi:uncharacterized membrane protein YagU involved in acid resistance
MDEHQNPLAGALAGSVGGLVGGAIKLLCEKIAPPRPKWRQPPPGVLAAKITRAVAGTDLTKSQRENASNVIHWTFSILSGALYGAIAERVPRARTGGGTIFGFVVWAGLHEIALPLARATPPLAELPVAEQLNEFVTHAIYGATVERVRALLRG